MIIFLVAVATLVYWLVKRYCGKYLERCLPSPGSAYMSVRLSRSKNGDGEGKVEFIDGSKDYEVEIDSTEDTLGLIAKK